MPHALYCPMWRGVATRFADLLETPAAPRHTPVAMKLKSKRLRRLVRSFGLAAIILLLAYLVTVPTGWLCDRVILGRPGAAGDLAGATRRVIHVDGRAVECAVARSPGAIGPGREPQAYVLFLVGKGDLGDRWTAAVAGSWGERPVEVWGMNYPGFGGSEGPPRLNGVVPEALGTYDAIRQL